MPEVAKMKKAWWTDHKASTLSDSGETVAKALEGWEKAIKPSPSMVDFDKVAAALTLLSKAATALKGKANRVLHKETIGYLQKYITNCAEGLEGLEKADGKQILKSLLNLPKSVLDLLKEADPIWAAGIENNVLFLKAAKSGTGSADIYNEYIKESGAHQVNLPSALQARVVTAGEAGDWENAVWREAAIETAKMVKANQTGQSALAAAALADKRNYLQVLKNM